MQKMPLAQERLLVRAAQAGDEAAKVALIAQHDRQLWHIATHTRSRGETAEDLYQWAVLFFLESISKMDLRRNTRVTTWTYNIVRMRVQGMALRHGVIHIPSLAKRTAPDDYSRAISQVSGITDANFSMIDQQLGYEEHTVEEREERELVREAINNLPERLRRIIELRLDGYTLEQVGRHFAVSKERINQQSQDARRLIEQYIKSRTARRYMASVLASQRVA